MSSWRLRWRSRSGRARLPATSRPCWRRKRQIVAVRKPFARAPFAPLSARFLARETLAPFVWSIRDLHCYSVCFAAPENSYLVRNLVRVVSRFRAATKHESRQMAAGEHLNLAGPTGLEPATSGVTGRRSSLTNKRPRVGAGEPGLPRRSEIGTDIVRFPFGPERLETVGGLL